MPEIIIVAGPNGAGKTSFARQHVDMGLRTFTFVNADEISRELSAKSQTQRDLQATRLMLEQIDELAARRADFMIETTLAALTYIEKIGLWQRAGYHVSLIFLRLPSADHAVERVRRRVAAGGHAIPEETIRRRFTMGLDFLDKHYKQAVDAWYIVDSLEGSYDLAERSGD
jgi:predicted ABC-type ATPase